MDGNQFFYFEIITTIAIGLGLIIGNILNQELD